MNKFNKFGISLAVLSALSFGFTGCGSDDSSSTQTQESETNTGNATKTVTVERGKVYDANVTDSSTPEQTATQNEGTNTYTFANEITYPVKVNGGFIDVDSDGQYSEGDLELNIEMISYEDKVTPITTYISKDENGNYEDDAEKRELKLQELSTQLNDESANIEDLMKLPSEASTKSQMAINSVYAEMLDENSTAINLGEVSTRVSNFENMMSENKFQDLNSSEMALELEKALIADPDMNPSTDDAMKTVTITEAGQGFNTTDTTNTDNENEDSENSDTDEDNNNEDMENTGYTIP